METLTEKKFSFAEFELDGVRRRLFRNGESLALKSRTFDLLLILVERRGQVLSKDELLEAVWPGQFIEESNLTVHISTLRKILGEKKDEHRFIVTVPGRGYSFVSELTGELTGERANEDESEIILESHRLERIVVEEDFEDTENLAGRKLIDSGSSDRSSPFSGRLIFAAIFLAAILGLGAYFFRASFTRAANVPFQQISLRRLTNTGDINRAALSPDGKLFIYTVSGGAHPGLWLGHVDGGDPILLREPGATAYFNLAFAPDSSAIYYATGNPGAAAIYKIPVFGGVPEKVFEPVHGFSFAPDGKRFAFLRASADGSKTTIMAANTDGGDEHSIADLPADITGGWGSPEWSSDGLTMAIFVNKVEETKVFVVDIGAKTTRPLTNKIWRNLTSLKWLSDGSGLIATGTANDSLLPQLWFISFPAGDVRRLSHDLSDYGYFLSVANDKTVLTVQGFSQSNIWVAPAQDLKDAKQVTFGSPGRQDGWFGLAWTPDGRVVYTADTVDGTTLWIMNADGSKQKQLIPNGGVNSYPSVTADGRSVIFQSNRSGHFAIWRADLDGENMKQLTGEQIAAQPSVSPDGKWILYTSNIESPGELWRIPGSGSEPVRLTEKPGGWSSISPDSKLVATELSLEQKPKLAILSIENGELVKLFEIPPSGNLRLGIHWTPDGKAVTYRDWSDGILKQNVEGGEPQHIEGLPREKLFSYGWAFDGKNFAFTRGTTSRDVVLISGDKASN